MWPIEPPAELPINLDTEIESIKKRKCSLIISNGIVYDFDGMELDRLDRLDDVGWEEDAEQTDGKELK